MRVWAWRCAASQGRLAVRSGQLGEPALPELEDARWHHAKFIQKLVPQWQVGAEKPCQNANGRHRLSHAFLSCLATQSYAPSVLFVIVKGQNAHIP